jgi:hypothetical protein
MTDFAVFFALLFMLSCGSFVVLHSRPRGRLSLLDWCFLGMGGVYGLGWSFVLLVTANGENPTWAHLLLPNSDLYLIHTLCASLLACNVYLGWIIASEFFSFRRPNFVVIPEAKDTKFHSACWILLIGAFVMQWFYARAYGGFIGSLEYSALVRSGIFIQKNSLSFLRPFGGMAFSASFGFFGLWLGCRSRLPVIVGLVTSISFSLYILFSWLGRIGFIIYIITFVLGYVLYKRPRPLRLLMFSSTLPIAILGGAYGVSVWFNIKTADNIGEFLARELSFPFGSFFAQWSSGEHLWRGFYDIAVAPLYFLPSSWWGGWVENVSQINTALISGAPKGAAGVTGGIPVDLLTLGLMQADILGILVIGLIFGVLLRTVQYWLDGFTHRGVGAIFEAAIILNISFVAIFYAQPSNLIEGNFHLFVAAFLFWAMLHRPKVRFSRHAGR